MKPTDSLVLPRTTVVSAAMAAANRAKIVAGVSGIAALICLIFAVADAVGASPDRNDAAAISWVVIFGAIALFAVLRARRALATAQRAAADTGATWTLVGKLVFVRDDRGQPTFDHSFKVTAAQRAAMLSCLQPTSREATA